MTEPQSSEERREVDRDVFTEAMDDPSVLKIYANTFGFAYGSTDFTLLLQCNGKTTAILNLSFPFAKTLAQTLLRGIESVEEVSAQVILDIPTMERMQQEYQRKRAPEQG